MTRVKIAEFGIIQKTLANAVVTFFLTDSEGANTGVKATIYQAATGSSERSNPQTLDADGKLSADCYVDAAIMATITGINERTERSIRKIRQNPTEFSLPVTSSNINAVLASEDAADADADRIAAEAAKVAAEAARDAALTAETNAETAETNAEASEIAAAASAAAAAASAAEGLWNNVITLTNADSPYVPSAAQEGTLFRLDMTSGAIIINLSTLATYAEDMKFGFVKTDASGNSATINRGGSDTISGGTSVTLANRYEVNSLVGDSETGEWINVIQSPTLANDSVTNAMLVNMAQATIKGRASGAGTGDPTDLTGAQVATIIGGATTSATGVVELATDAEAQAKADTARAITPSNLAALGASETFAGFVELATNAETLTGTDTARALTPDDLAHALRNSLHINPRYRTTVFTDLFHIVDCTTSVSGTGAQVSPTTSSTNSPGRYSIERGTTTTGRAGLYYGAASGTTWTISSAVHTVAVYMTSGGTASDGTNTFVTRYGWMDSFTGEPTNGVYFRYTHSTNSGNLQCVCRASGVETVINTSQAGHDATNLELKWVGTNTSIEFFINGVSQGTITTNIPTAGSGFGAVGASIVGSAGTANRITNIDALFFNIEITGGRA